MLDIPAQIKIQKHCREEQRFTAEAYTFIFEVLDYSVRKLGLENKKGAERHMDAQQLLKGVRDYAEEHYGYMSKVVLEHMGISFSEDVGELVFQLIDLGLLQKLPTDSKDDFTGGLDLNTAFDGLA